MELRSYVSIHSQTLLAKKLGVDRSLVSQWLSGRTKITAERALQIERTTNGVVSRSDLRPDLWPPQDSQDRGVA